MGEGPAGRPAAGTCLPQNPRSRAGTKRPARSEDPEAPRAGGHGGWTTDGKPAPASSGGSFQQVPGVPSAHTTPRSRDSVRSAAMPSQRLPFPESCSLTALSPIRPLPPPGTPGTHPIPWCSGCPVWSLHKGPDVVLSPGDGRLLPCSARRRGDGHSGKGDVGPLATAHWELGPRASFSGTLEGPQGNISQLGLRAPTAAVQGVSGPPSPAKESALRLGGSTGA